MALLVVWASFSLPNETSRGSSRLPFIEANKDEKYIVKLSIKMLNCVLLISFTNKLDINF